MALPFAPNATCDIYRAGNAPPSAPDVAGVSCHVRPAYREGRERGDSEAAQLRYTHVLSVDLAVDVRDDFSAFTGSATNRDVLYIPDQTGVGFQVNFVERVNRGGSGDHKRVYLDRKLPAWPMPTHALLAHPGGAQVGGQPAVVSASLLAWYKADAITGLVDNDPVAAWLDSSGNGNDSAQATAGNQPIYKTNQINGLPAVRFDGVDDFLSIASNFDRDSLTLLVIANMTGPGQGAAAYYQESPFGGANTSSWSMLQFASTHPTEVPGGWGVTKNYVDHATTVLDQWLETDGWSILGMRLDGTNLTLKRGTTTVDNLSYAQTFSGGAPYQIGTCVSVCYFDGYIAELLLFDGALSDAGFDTVITDLETKYNL